MSVEFEFVMLEDGCASIIGCPNTSGQMIIPSVLTSDDGSEVKVYSIGESWVILPDTVTTWQEAVEAIKAGVTEMYSKNRSTFGTVKYVTKSTLLWFKRGGRRMDRRPVRTKKIKKKIDE